MTSEDRIAEVRALDAACKARGMSPCQVLAAQLQLTMQQYLRTSKVGINRWLAMTPDELAELATEAYQLPAEV